MKISLAQAVPLMAQLDKEFTEANGKLHKTVLLSYMKSEGRPDATGEPEQYFGEMMRIQGDLAILRSLVAKANLVTYVDFLVEGREGGLNLNDALALVKQMRSNVQLLKWMGEQPDKPQAAPYYRREKGEDIQMSVSNLASPKQYLEQARKLERQANRLSLAIDMANLRGEIEFDASRYIEV